MAEYHIGQKIWRSGVSETTELLPKTNVIKLVITTIPGVKFKLNDSNNIQQDQVATIEIGRTGLFELDLKGLGMTINSIKIDPTDSREENINGEKKTIYTHAETINNNYCYIDYIYEDVGGASS